MNKTKTNTPDRYKRLYELEKTARIKLEAYVDRLNELIDTKDKELKKAQQELNNNRLVMSNDLEMAKNIQTGLIDKTMPDMCNMDVASLYRPAEKIGSDMYEVIPINETKTALVISDVSGDGVPSALICTMVKTLFVHYIKSGRRPSEIFSAIHTDICSLCKTDRYLTAFLGIIDHADNSMIYSQAGHVYPVIYHHKTGATTFIPGNSIFIGHASLSGIATYHDSWLSLEWGDKIILYTDGLTEAMDPKGELYGSQQLCASIQKHGRHPLETFIQKIAEDHDTFRNGTVLRDDFTILCVQIGCPEKILTMSGFTKDDCPEMLLLRSYDEIENICSIILKKLEKKGYTKGDGARAHQSMHELLSNAIKHGNKYNPDKKVFVLYAITPETFRISVMDEGKGFNYKSVLNQMCEHNDTGGYGKGLYIVKNYMDDVAFNDKGNRVMIRKFQTQER